MNLHLRELLLISGLFCCSMCGHALAVEVKTENGIEYHESGNNKIAFTLLEDVLYLLPENIMDNLRPVLYQIMINADFSVDNEYWKKRKMSKAEFVQNYTDIQKQSEYEGYRLGRSVKDIIEIALSPANDDAMNTQWQKNVTKFMRSARESKYTIKYEGYNNETLENLTDQLYDLNLCEKESIYPNIVVVTAKLWIAIFKKNNTTYGNNVSFVRRPPLIIFESNSYAMLEQMRSNRFNQDSSAQISAWNNKYYESLNIRRQILNTSYGNTSSMSSDTNPNISGYKPTSADSSAQSKRNLMDAQKEISNTAKDVLRSGK